MNFIKENFSTIILISLIIIILLLLGIGFFIYKVASDNNNVDIAETPENILNINTSYDSVMEKQERTPKIVNSVTDETVATQSTLSQIANIFNTCNASQRMRSQGYTMDAVATQNKITVFSSGDGLSFNVDFILDNNILYTKIIYNQADPRVNAVEVMLAVILVDCVGQVNGYPDGVLSNALGNDDAMNYTIENEGVEIRQLDNGKDMIVKVDLNSNFSFLGT